MSGRGGPREGSGRKLKSAAGKSTPAAVRLPPDVWESVQAVMAAHDLSKSDALLLLIRRGLEAGEP